MNNRIKLIFSFLLISYSVIVNSQNKSGVITYKIKSYLHAEKSDNEKFKYVMNEQNRELEKMEFNLIFNASEAVFSIKEKLDVDTSDELFQRLAKSVAGNGIYYTNEVSKEKIEKRNFIGDNFLIKYPYAGTAWKITDEKKIIGKYTCYKALLEKQLGGKDSKIINVIAWFSPTIPIKFGPKIYTGLPGLILELKEGNLVYYVSDISFEKEVRVKKPRGGHKLTEKEFKIYAEERIEQLGFKRN